MARQSSPCQVATTREHEDIELDALGTEEGIRKEVPQVVEKSKSQGKADCAADQWSAWRSSSASSWTGWRWKNSKWEVPSRSNLEKSPRQGLHRFILLSREIGHGRVLLCISVVSPEQEKKITLIPRASRKYNSARASGCTHAVGDPMFFVRSMSPVAFQRFSSCSRWSSVEALPF